MYGTVAVVTGPELTFVCVSVAVGVRSNKVRVHYIFGSVCTLYFRE